MKSVEFNEHVWCNENDTEKLNYAFVLDRVIPEIERKCGSSQ
jgi:hypothetical protein